MKKFSKNSTKFINKLFIEYYEQKKMHAFSFFWLLKNLNFKVYF